MFRYAIKCEINIEYRGACMSLTSELRAKMKLYMLEHIERNDKDLIAKTMDTFSVSKTTVYNYLERMVKDQLIVKPSNPKTGKYELYTSNTLFHYSTSSHLEEDRIFSHDILPIISNLPKNVRDIWSYAFTEMMNNAIEHSEASKIDCLVSQNFLNTQIFISDNGIGIFRKIQKYFLEERGDVITLDEAVDALFPGKLTTARENHSGEGIFFTSRAVDRFVICSDERIFAHQPFLDRKINIEQMKDHGTIVDMVLSNTSAKPIKEVFDMFTDPDRGFFKTQIPIAHMFANGYPVSRSEARRLGMFVKDFEEITFDFANVDQVGQAFTHELFIVFQNKHPQIHMNVVNANEDVASMIKRVKHS